MICKAEAFTKAFCAKNEAKNEKTNGSGKDTRDKRI
jgi:hypothetical protein